METLERARVAALTTISQQSTASQKLAADEAALAEREAQLTQIINTRTRAMELNTAKLETNAAAIQRLPFERFQAGAQMIEHAGRALQMFGLIGTAVFGALAKYAADFNTQVTLAATQAIEPSRNSVQQIQRISAALSSGILKILQSGTAVSSSAEINKSAYDILSGITQLSDKSAVKIKQTLGLLKEFNLVTKANFGLVTFNQVTQAGITLMNSFGITFKQLPGEFDVMQKAVNRGRLTLGQFIDGLNQTAAPAKAAGFTFDQMAATLSFLSTKFPNYNRAAVGYARLVEILANPKFVGGLKAAGVSITDLSGKHLLPLDQIIQKLVKRFPQLQKGGLFVQNFFKQFSGQTGFIGARRAFTFLAQDPLGLDKFTKDIPKARGLVNASATALSQTGAVKWAELVTQLKALAIVIGQDVIPVFVQLAKPLEAAAKWFNNLSPSAQKTIATFGALASIGALLGGTLLAVVGGIAAAGIGFLFFVRELREARVAMATTEAGAIGLRLALGLALGLGIAAAIFLLIKYHTQVMHVVDALGGLKAILIAVATAMITLRGIQFASAIVAGFRTVTAATTTAIVATEALTSVEAVQAATARLAAISSGELAVADEAIGAASVAAAGEVGILETSLLALGGPAVLAALAAGAAALAFYYGFKDAPKINKLGTVPGSGGERTVVESRGKLFERVRTATRGSQPTFRRELTPQQARGLGANINIPDKAIKQAIANSPRYQHVINANASALHKQYLEEMKLETATRARNAITNHAGAIAHTQIRTVSDWINIIEKAHAATLGDPTDIAKAKTYEQLQIDLNKRFKDQPALLAAINDVLSTYDSNLKSATNSASTLGVTFQDVLSSVQSKFNDFQQQEQGIFGTLFQGPFVNSPAVQNRLQFGGLLGGQDLLKDLKSQVTQFSAFHGQLNQLGRAGAPSQLIQQITQLGPDAVMGKLNQFGQRTPSLMQQILGLNPKQRAEYFRTFRQSQRMIQQQAMNDLKSQLNQYRKHGRDIALAIVAGIKDENVAVTKSLTNMIHNMFPGLPTGATGAGGKPTHHPQATKTEVHHHKTEIHVVAPKKDHASIKAQIRHADLARRNRYTGRGPGPR
jgi:TP901 family phage tail tape measure protein